VVLATALAAGMTHEQAAKAAGVSKRTVARRLADPAFRNLMDAEQDRIVGRFTGTTVAGLEKAIARLIALVESEREGVALGGVSDAVGVRHPAAGALDSHPTAHSAGDSRERASGQD